MDIVTLALAKAFTEKTVDGLGALKGANAVITSITKENGISTVTFEWTGTSGTKETDSMQVKDGEKGDTGLSVKALAIDENEHLIITDPDNTTEDAGAMPKIELEISAEGGNALIQKEDGLYVAEGAVVISPDENNALESRENGLYAENKDLSNYVQIYNEEGNPGWIQNEVDSELSKTSERPVQNKVITAELEKIKSTTANNDYKVLNNKPSIEGIELINNLTFEDLHIASADNLAKTNETLQNLSDSVGNKNNLPMPTDTVVDNIAEINNNIAIKKLSNEQSVLVDSTEVTFTYDNVNKWWKSDKNAITYQANLPTRVNYIVDIDNGAYVAEAGNNMYQKILEDRFYSWQAIGNVAPLGWSNYFSSDDALPFLIEQDFEENKGEIHIYLFPDKGLTITGTHTIKITKSITKYSPIPYELHPYLSTIRPGGGSYSIMAPSGGKATGQCSMALGDSAYATSKNSIALGGDSQATGANSIALGYSSQATGNYSIALGAFSQATGINAMALGGKSQATGLGAIALGGYSTKDKVSVASGAYAVVAGNTTTATGNFSFAQGAGTEAKGQGSHTEGLYTIAAGKYQHTEGKYNIEDTEEKYAHIIGGGTDDTARKNIHTVDWSGNAEYTGDVTATDSNGNKTNLLETVHKVYSMEIGNSAIDPVVINDFKIDPTYRYLYIINGSGTTDYEVGILMFINGMKFIPLSSSSSQTTIKDSVSAIGIHIYIENGKLKVSRDEISNGVTCAIYKLG